MQNNSESSQELQVVEATPVAAQPAQPNMVIMAMERGIVDPEMISKMMDLQERNERREAEKAYIAAMAAFKANPPRIAKDKHVEFRTSKGVTSYDHASLGNVTSAINAALASNGLSASWDTKQDGSQITVTCKITHALGHSESTSLTAQPDNSGTKNAIQSVGSTVSYLQRYTLLAMTGLATHDQDDDGAGLQPVEYISQEKIDTILKMLEEKNRPLDGVYKWLKVDRLEDIPANWWDRVYKGLKEMKAAK